MARLEKDPDGKLFDVMLKCALYMGVPHLTMLLRLVKLEIAMSLLPPKRLKARMDQIKVLRENPATQETLSLNFLLQGKEEEFEVGELLTAPDERMMRDNELSHQILFEKLFRSDALNSQEKLVLRLCFGIDEGHPHTIDEISDRLHFSKDWVRKILSKALRKAKSFLKKNKVKPEVLFG